MAKSLTCGPGGEVGLFCRRCGIRGTTIPCGHGCRGPVLSDEGFGLSCETCNDRASGRTAIAEAAAAESSRSSWIENNVRLCGTSAAEAARSYDANRAVQMALLAGRDPYHRAGGGRRRRRETW